MTDPTPGNSAGSWQAEAALAIWRFSSRASCERALLATTMQQLHGASAAAPLLVVSGGSTPAEFYKALSAAELQWENISVTLSDERWVEESDPASNARMLRATLLRGRAGRAQFISLKTKAASPTEGVAECNARLRRCTWPAAMTILGMGTDGHTASLFPDDPGLAAGLKPSASSRVVAAQPASMEHARVSLSLPTLLDTRLVCLLLYGQSKWRVLNEALDEGPDEAMPVRAILRQRQVPVRVFWAP